MINQRLKDGKRFHVGAHCVPNPPRNGYGDKYLETVAESGRPTIVYGVWTLGRGQVEGGDYRAYDTLREAKEKYAEHSPLGSDGVLTIGRMINMWQPGMPTDHKRDLEAFEPAHYNHYNADDYIDPATGENLGVIGSARAAARDYWFIIWPTIQQNRGWVDVFGAFNEFSFHWEFQSDFFIELMKLANAEGVILCLGNYSSGNPPRISEADDPEQFEVFDKWLPWLDYAGRHGHLFCTHEYAELGPLHVGRFIPMYERMEEKGIVAPSLVIGESGWVTYPGDGVFMATVRANEDLYRQYPYLIGDCKFTYGKWINANIQTASKPFGQFLASVEMWPEKPDPPPEEPPPIIDRGKPRFDYKRAVNVVPPDDPLLNAWSWYTYRLTENENRAVSIFLEGWRRGRETTGGSYDDAFVADLTHRLGNLFDIDPDKEQDFVTFRDDWYPGGKIDFRESVDLSEPDEPEPPPLDHPEFWLASPVPSIPFHITDPFNTPRPYGKHEGVDIRSWNKETGTTARISAAQYGTIIATRTDNTPKRDYGNYVDIQHDGPWKDGKIYVTRYAHLDSIFDSLKVGQFVERGHDLGYGGKTDADSIHLHLNLQRFNQDGTDAGLSGYFVRSVVDPEPYLPDVDTPPPPPPPEPTHKPLRLLHLKAKAGGTITDDAWQTDIEMLREAGMDGAKWTSNNQLESIAWIRNSTGLKTENMIIRLYSAGDNPSLTNAKLWFDEQYKWINWAQNAGMLIEIHNESNLPDEWPESANAFASWFADVATMTHARWPNARVGFPGLSPKPGTKAFYEACYDAIRIHADWIGVHCYFSADGSGAFGIDNDSADQAGGLYWQRIIEWIPPNIPIWITEFADNGDGADIDRARRTAEYFSKDYPLRIKGLVCYISQDSNFPKQEWVSNPHMVAAVAGR